MVLIDEEGKELGVIKPQRNQSGTVFLISEKGDALKDGMPRHESNHVAQLSTRFS